GTLPELGSGDDALEFVERHQCSPDRNAHAKHASSAPTYGKTCRCCGRSAPSSSAAATHGSGGGRSGSVTTGTRPHLCSSRQSIVPHFECAATPIVAMSSDGGPSA